MAFLAILVVGFLSLEDAKKMGMEQHRVLFCFIWGGLVGFLGARIGWMIKSSSSFMEIFMFWRGGFSMVGGIIGGALGGFMSSKVYSLRFLKLTDIVAVYSGFGVYFARIGCFLTGCCFGVQTSLPWGVRYTRGSPAYLFHNAHGLISSEDKFSHPVHPVQLYEAILGLLISTILLLARKKIHREGIVFFIAGIFYITVRLLLTSFRQ